MTEEPRIRFEDSNGNIISEIGHDADGSDIIVERGGEQYQFGNDGTLDTPAVNTDDLQSDNAVTGTFRSHAVGGGDNGSLGMQITSTPELHADFVEGNVLLGFDPDIYHKSHFDDNRYRFTITEDSNSNTQLYSAESIIDPSTWTLEASEIMGSGSTKRRVNDHIVLPDGRFAVYVTDDDNANTYVWVGESLTSLSNQGKVMSDNDCATIRRPNGTVEIVAENLNDTANVRDANSLKRYTTPVNDLTNATDHGVVVDLDGTYGWPGGDPDFVTLGGRTYMFLDRKVSEYLIALFVTDDFESWDLVTAQLTGAIGGDFTVTKAGGELHAFTEQSEGSSTEIATWRVRTHHASPRWEARNRGVSWNWNANGVHEFTSGTSGSGNAVVFDASSSRAELSTGTTSGSKSNLVKWLLKGYSPQSPKLSWSVNRTMTADVKIDPNGEAYVVTGAADTGALSLKHVGIGATGGDLIGSVGNGSSQTTTTLISGAGVGEYQLRVEFEANKKAKFYVNDKKEGEITSGLPSGTAEATRMFMAFVANSTSTNRQLYLYRARVGQEANTRRF